MMPDETQRIIGKLEEFRKVTYFRLESMEKKLDNLIHFKWKVIGIVTCLVFIVEVVAEIVKAGSK